MLAQLGNLQFTVAPFNMNGNDHDAGASFASHEVIGRMPTLEFVGEAPESWRIQGTIFAKELGGMEELAILQSMRRSGTPQFFMRGDGVPMGWFVVESVRERSRYLDRDGVGRAIEFEIVVKRADAPNASGAFNSLFSLFQ